MSEYNFYKVSCYTPAAENPKEKASMIILADSPESAVKMLTLPEPENITVTLYDPETERANPKYTKLAESFINAIHDIAESPENMENLCDYLSYHFPEWLHKYANTPEGITSELQEFSDIY